MCKKLLREPCGTEYICFFSLLGHLNLYSRLPLSLSKCASFPLGWERERLVAFSYSACCFSDSHTKLAVTLNQNISPVLKHLNQTLEALKLWLWALGIRRWRTESVHKHHSSLFCLEGGQCLTLTRTALLEPAPWVGESVCEGSSTSCVICMVIETKYSGGMASSRVTRCQFVFPI